MRSFPLTIAILAILVLLFSCKAQTSSGPARSTTAITWTPGVVAPLSDHPAAQRATGLLQAIASTNAEEKTSFVAAAWQLREGETIGSVVKDLDRLAFLLGKELKTEKITLDQDSVAAVELLNNHGRRSIIRMKVEADDPHRLSIVGLERTPLDLPKDLREPRKVNMASPVISAPLTFESTRPMVDVTIGDKGPFRFMLETGSDVVVISPQVAAAVRGSLTPVTADLMWEVNGQQISSTYILSRLNIGGAELEQLGVLVLPMQPGEDGILGLAAYRDLLLGLDLANSTMTLQQGSLPDIDGKEILPLRPLGPLLAVEVVVGDNIVPFEIDTQADNNFFLATELASDRMFEGELIQIGTVITAGGQHRAPSMMGRLSGDLRLGKFVFQKPLIRVRPDPEDSIPPSGLLGASAMKHFVVTMDQKNMRIRFSRQEAPVIAPPPSYRGIDFNIFAGRDGIPTVVDLDPDSEAAKAGLREGDVVVSFAGRPGIEAAGNVRRIVQTTEPIEVEVMRGKEPLKVTVHSHVLVM